MLDAYMRNLIDPPLDAAGRGLARLGISANAVTMAGLALGLCTVPAIALGHFGAALFLICLSRLADGLDGAVARASRRTDFGGYLDITADFLFYGAVPFGFILYNPAFNGLAGGFLLLSFYVNGSSFLGYAILAEKHGMDTTAQGVKSLYYSNGLLEGTETIVFFALLCLAPLFFPPLAAIFGLLCFATAFLRVYGAYQAFAPTQSNQKEP